MQEKMRGITASDVWAGKIRTRVTDGLIKRATKIAVNLKALGDAEPQGIDMRLNEFIEQYEEDCADLDTMTTVILQNLNGRGMKLGC